MKKIFLAITLSLMLVMVLNGYLISTPVQSKSTNHIVTSNNPFQIVGGYEGQTIFNLNSQHPIPNEKKVRQAIAYCTDRHALAEAAYPTLTEPEIDALMLDSFLVKTHWAYHEPTTQYPFDPDSGRSLLDEAGWNQEIDETYRTNALGDPLVLKLTTTDAAFRYAWAEVFEGQMLDCGIWVVRLHLSPSWMFGEKTGIYRRDFEMSGYTNDANDDEPDVISHFGCDYIPSAENGWQGYNLTGWCNSTASQAAEFASDTNLTQVERLPYFEILQEEYAKDVPSLPLFVRNDGFTLERIDFNLGNVLGEVFLPLVIQ